MTEAINVRLAPRYMDDMGNEIVPEMPVVRHGVQRPARFVRLTADEREELRELDLDIVDNDNE